MEDSLKQLLCTYKLAHLIPFLNDAGVHERAVLGMVKDDSDLKELIPSLVDRIKIKHIIAEINAEPKKAPELERTTSSHQN